METGIHLQDSGATARAAYLHSHGNRACWTLRLSETAEAAELGDEVTVYLYRESVLTLAEAVLEAAVGLGADLGDLAAVRLHQAAQAPTQDAQDASWLWEPIDREGNGRSYRCRYLDRATGHELTVELDGTGTLDSQTGQAVTLTEGQLAQLLEDQGPGGYPDDSPEACCFTDGYARAYWQQDHPSPGRDPEVRSLRLAYCLGILAGRRQRLAEGLT